MNRYGSETDLTPSDVVEKATEFFGKDLGLEVVESEIGRVCFEGGGGHVTVTACPNEKTEVDIETREWDYQVEEFLKKL